MFLHFWILLNSFLNVLLCCVLALILRGLDALTTEDNILHVMSQISTFPLKNVQIIRDDATNTSKGFGFMELNTVNEAHQLLDQFNNRVPLEVDGKQLLVNYAKNTFSTV